MCKAMRRTKIKKSNPPSKPEAATNLAVHSNVSSTVTASPANSRRSPNMRHFSSDSPPLTTGASSSANSNADCSSSIGESIYVPGATIEQHTSVSPTHIISRAYAAQQAATVIPNAIGNNLLLGRRQSGDWLDKLEAAIYPTPPPPAPLGLTDTVSWMSQLEPRPIRPARGGMP